MTRKELKEKLENPSLIHDTSTTMKQEDKELLFKDLCARLPYGVICNLYDVENPDKKFQLNEIDSLMRSAIETGCVKLYLRPMSSMTFKETREFLSIKNNGEGEYLLTTDKQDWLNKKMFDYRGLIPMGLALKAKEGMYKID